MKTLLLTALLASAAFSQDPAATPATPVVTDIKAYLTLTDAQIAGLEKIQAQQQTVASTVDQQIQTAQSKLDALLAANSTDANAAGTLLLQINALRKQIDSSAASLRTQAVALLTADQKTKLTALDAASKLRPAIDQAAFLMLLAPPAQSAATTPGPGGPGGPGGAGGPGPHAVNGPSSVQN